MAPIEHFDVAFQVPRSKWNKTAPWWASSRGPRAGRSRGAPAVTLGTVRGQVVRRIAASRAGVTTLRLRIVESAVALLTSPDLERVKACPGCGWFFLDETKNGSRRWCSMRMCGSLAKSRRYYLRKRTSG